MTLPKTLSTSTLLLVILAIALTACKPKPVGGNCNATNSTELAQVTQVAQRVILQSSTNEFLDAATEQFAPPAELGHHYQLNVRRHTSGGCQPRVVQSVAPLSKAGVNLNPTDAQLYQAAFALDIARNCAHQEAEACADELKLGDDFKLHNTPTLDTLKPRSLGICSAIALADVWPTITADAEQPRVIGCVDTTEGRTRAVEFLQSGTGNPIDGLWLNKIY